jgi:hypothetical protein
LPNKVFVRHPREFLPLLNLVTINNDVSMFAVFNELRRALDSLLAGFPPSTSQGGVYREPSTDIIIASLAARGSSSAKVEELKKIWTKANKLAVTLSVSVLGLRDREIFDTVARLICAEDLKTHIQREIIEEFDKLIGRHSSLTVEGVFIAIQERFSTRLNGDRDLNAALLRVASHSMDDDLFGEVIGGRSLDDILLDATRGVDHSQLFRNLVDSGDIARAYLVLGWLCLAVGLWEPAKDFAKFAKSVSSSPAISDSTNNAANYLFAVTRRLNLRYMNDFIDAKTALENIIDYHTEHRQLALRIRAESELAALALGGIEQSLIVFDRKAVEDDRLIAFDDRSTDNTLELAARKLNTCRHTMEDGSPHLFYKTPVLFSQVIVNSAVYSILIKVMQRPGLRSRLDMSDDIIIEHMIIIVRNQYGISPVSEMYLRVLEALQVNADTDTQIAALTLLTEKGDDRKLPRTDRDLAFFLREALVRWIENNP